MKLLKIELDKPADKVGAQPERWLFELSADDVAWLQAICDSCGEGSPATTGPALVVHLVNAAIDGAQRPGAWERSWLRQVVPIDDEIGEPDPRAPWRRRLP